MKSLLTALALSAIALFGAPTVGAATLSESFVSSGGIPFTIADARKVEQISGAVRLTYNDGSNSGTQFTDSTGNLYAAIKASAEFQTKFVKIQGAETYINVESARYFSCWGSSVLWVTWPAPSGAENIPDTGCVTFNQIKALSN